MEKTKRKRLEAAGWQVGSAADFVGLSDEEAAYVELCVRLSDALKNCISPTTDTRTPP